MGDTTVSSVFPDDELRQGLQQLIRLSRILEPHSGAGTHASLSEVMALGELADVEQMSQHELARLLGLEKVPVPSMVLVTGPHFAVFEGVRRGRVHVNDPSLGSYSATPALPDRHPQVSA